MDNIEIYNNSAIILNKKTPKSIISWITILISLLIMLVILFSVPFNIYKSYSGYVYIQDNSSYLILMLEESDFPINKNNKLYIKNTKYDYDIVNINNKEVTLKLKLKDNIKIENNLFVVNILKDRTTVFKILKKKIMKGFGL